MRNKETHVLKGLLIQYFIYFRTVDVFYGSKEGSQGTVRMMSQDQNEGADNRNWTNFFSVSSFVKFNGPRLKEFISYIMSDRCLTVSTDVDFLRELSDLDLKSILDRLRGRL